MNIFYFQLKIAAILGFIVVSYLHCLNAKFSVYTDEQRLGNRSWMGISSRAVTSLHYFWIVIEWQINAFSFVNHLFFIVLTSALTIMGWEFEKDLKKIGENAVEVK